MKIFFTASFHGKEKYQKYYDLVLTSLKAEHVELISPELGNYKSLLSSEELKKLKDPKAVHYEAIKKGIIWSDAVVIEISEENFQLGHEATLAIQNKKHVLCLSIHEDFSLKIKNRYFHAAKYNQFNVEELVENFVTKVKGELFMRRFNLFISDAQTKYLEEVSKKEGINMSEYLRMLIDRDRN